nr:MAG TPA: hypothetical protein [Caudoviricetes sp.]
MIDLFSCIFSLFCQGIKLNRCHIINLILVTPKVKIQWSDLRVTYLL